MSKIVFLGENFGGQAYELLAEKTTVGRGDKNKLAIRDDSVSSAHCEILVNGPEVIVHDLDSANGTFVNGVRVRGQRQVKDGQILRFGSVEARLELDMEDSDETASEQTAVHAMGRIMRQQSEARNNPKPPDAPVKLTSRTAAELTDHTILLMRPTAPVEPLAAQPSAPVPDTASQAPRALRKWMLAVAALGLAALAWWLVWGRK